MCAASNAAAELVHVAAIASLVRVNEQLFGAR
jgi:hypothetical protein